MKKIDILIKKIIDFIYFKNLFLLCRFEKMPKISEFNTSFEEIDTNRDGK